MLPRILYGPALVVTSIAVVAGLSAEAPAQDCTPGHARWCSTAPCYSGTQICGQDGYWGPCEGIDIDDTAIVPDGNPCTEDLCEQGIPSYPPSPEGTECPDGTCDGEGNCEPLGAIEIVPRGRHRLADNVPNPFNPSTRFEFHLAHPALVRLDVFDMRGRLLRRLIEGVDLEQGSHSAVWNGRSQSGIEVESGVYFCRFQAGDHVETKRMTLLK